MICKKISAPYAAQREDNPFGAERMGRNPLNENSLRC
jgi:hypothetical protein